ncbi:DUF1003 domain-containing protein [Novosphingobium sp. FSY-8]|uniref:DUF1003 domain-containing protein n=1 Tax=Novosphingobium ovatum TaxID=1908523 RepID=A0ABW9XB45_9SPHN|nr:DUF1003 domain-containing protein [Novosphingobium ovatum]NBC35753.1 DUF1003 domain-containing protein [Novosphingobium ovatum]
MRFDHSPERLAEELLGRPYHDLDAVEQRVLHRVADHTTDLDPDEREQIHMTYGERLADRVAAVGGSWGFIIFFGVVLVSWMVLNSPPMARFVPSWDGYPYIFLNLMLSMLAAFQAPVIMMSQNRQSLKDRIASRHDYEVNLRTTMEILLLKRKVDLILVNLHRLEREGSQIVSHLPVQDPPADQ